MSCDYLLRRECTDNFTGLASSWVAEQEELLEQDEALVVLSLVILQVLTFTNYTDRFLIPQNHSVAWEVHTVFKTFAS